MTQQGSMDKDDSELDEIREKVGDSIYGGWVTEADCKAQVDDIMNDIVALLEAEKLKARKEELENIVNLSDGVTVNLDSSHDNYILKVYVVNNRLAELEEKK